MGLDYINLNDAVRQYMLAEFDQGSRYYSPRLNEAGKRKWDMLLKDALQYHTDIWLERELIRHNCFLNEEILKSSMGRTVKRAVNKAQSARILAEREFNRYYLRGLCMAAAAQDKSHLLLYKARSSAELSEDMKRKIGTLIDCKALLAILRARSVSLELVLSIEGAAHYTLSARIPSPWELKSLLEKKKSPA